MTYNIIMSITVILSILSFIKKNWKLILCGVVFILSVFTITAMSIKLSMSNNKIKKLETTISELEYTNAFQERQIIDKNKELLEIQAFTNSLNKINKTYKYALPKEDIEAYDSIIDDVIKGGTL